MGEQVINNGSFDNDGSAEKIRLAFQKVKEMFAEIYAQIPLEDADMAAKAGQFLRVNAGETAAEWAAIAGGGDMLASNNLSELVDPSVARTNLGLGAAAVRGFIDEDSFASNSATAAPSQQSVKAYVDANVNTYTAGTGIAISGANVISNTSTANNVTGVSINASTRVLTITLTSGSVTVDLSAHLPLIIDGYQVTKVTGTDTSAIEVDDKIVGWNGNQYLAGKVTALPYTTAGNVSNAVDGTVL